MITQLVFKWSTIRLPDSWKRPFFEWFWFLDLHCTGFRIDGVMSCNRCSVKWSQILQLDLSDEIIFIPSLIKWFFWYNGFFHWPLFGCKFDYAWQGSLYELTVICLLLSTVFLKCIFVLVILVLLLINSIQFNNVLF